MTYQNTRTTPVRRRGPKHDYNTSVDNRIVMSTEHSDDRSKSDSPERVDQ